MQPKTLHPKTSILTTLLLASVALLASPLVAGDELPPEHPEALVTVTAHPCDPGVTLDLGALRGFWPSQSPVTWSQVERVLADTTYEVPGDNVIANVTTNPSVCDTAGPVWDEAIDRLDAGTEYDLHRLTFWDIVDAHLAVIYEASPILGGLMPDPTPDVVVET